MSTVWDILSSDDPKEVVVAIDSTKRSDYSAKTWYFSTHPRTDASYGDFPSYLRSIGPLSQALSEDLFTGLATISPGDLTLLQSVIDPDDLSQLHDYFFAGHQVRVYIGLQSSTSFDPLDTFPIFSTHTVQTDPSINATGSGIEAVFPLASALERLFKTSLQTKRHLGIPSCVTYLTQSGRASAAHIAAYESKSYTVMGRFRVAAAQTTNGILMRHGSGTNKSLTVYIGSTGGGASGKILFEASFAGVSTTMVTSPSTYMDGKWHSWVASLSDKSHAYLMIDREIVGEYTPNVSVDTQNAVMDIGLNAFTTIGSILQVAYFNRYMPPSEARIKSEMRLEGTETGCISLWRGDDNTGTTIDDYGSGANDATIAGVQNTDWKWDASDLGEPELAGNHYPTLAGEVFNAQAILIDTNRERHRGNIDATDWYTSASNHTIVVKSRGTVLTGGGTDYTMPTNGGDGVFPTTSAEDEPVTFDLTKTSGSKPEAFLPTVGYDLLTHRAGITNIDSTQLARLSILCPWTAGWRTQASTTAGAALNEIFGKSGLAYYEDPDGNLFVDMLRPPVGYSPWGEPCVDFAGDGGINFGDIGDISATSCTLACWIKLNAVAESAATVPFSEQYLIQKGNNYTMSVTTTGASAGKLNFYVAGMTTTSPAGLIEPNRWYFVAGVFDAAADTNKVYVAEAGDVLAEVNSAVNTGTAAANSDPLYVGGTGSYTWGSIAGVQVWSSAAVLATLNLQSTLGSQPAGNESNLVFYAPLNEGEGNVFDLVSDTEAAFPSTAHWVPRLVIDLDLTPSVALSDFHRVDPASEITVQHSRNWHPMNQSDIDTGVSQAAALDLKREWNEVSADFPEVLANYDQHRKVFLSSALTSQEGAERLFAVMETRFSEDRWIGKLTFPAGLDISSRACGLRIGAELSVRGSIPSQLSEARIFRVVAVAPDPIKRSTVVVFWG